MLSKTSASAFLFVIFSRIYELSLFCIVKLMVVVTDGSILLLKCDYLLKNSDMGTRSALWSFANKFFTCGVIGVYVSDRFVGVAPVRGSSMSPTLNPGTTSLMGLAIGLYIKRYLEQIVVLCIMMVLI